MAEAEIYERIIHRHDELIDLLLQKGVLTNDDMIELYKLSKKKK